VLSSCVSYVFVFLMVVWYFSVFRASLLFFIIFLLLLARLVTIANSYLTLFSLYSLFNNSLIWCFHVYVYCSSSFYVAINFILCAIVTFNMPLRTIHVSGGVYYENKDYLNTG
jgi:hypothetical protein